MKATALPDDPGGETMSELLAGILAKALLMALEALVVRLFLHWTRTMRHRTALPSA
ncbi:hypothetical protein [Actinomadura kijaniata]|uniref:hypothetical protein n=1 Tax=Actinomadura kijaniata TaxID=46161 RepID=UPI000AE94513|nr:hypothetical protein [Actinomadura kijaniata]